MVRMALTRGGGSLSHQLNQVSKTAHWPSAIEIYLDGVAEISGPETAVERLSLLSLDLTQPWNADAMRSAVRHLINTGDPDAARTAVKAALGSHPQEAAFHAIAGLELELLSGNPADGKAEYERAIELDPNEAPALEALGRIAAEAGEHDSALAYFDRAADANPSEPEIQIRAAQLASKTPQHTQGVPPAPESKPRWQAISREFPWLPEPQMQLARIEIAGQRSKQALGLAERAVRLGGGSPAWTLLAEIHQQRGETELAEKAREQIKAPRATPPEPPEPLPSAS
jgi:tetratricopeptide (TPR) repeat protein